MILILGIETSCDDTSIAIYDGNNHKVLVNITNTQNQIHAPYGGIKPEIAARQHIIHISDILAACLLNANKTLSDIDGIAYTNRPGLTNSLVVGATFAKTLSYALNIPAIGIHHIEGHILSTWLEKTIIFNPYLALVVSGGHTQLFVVREFEYELLGESLDDAVGEVFDKCAKIMGLEYPGGPSIEKMALNAKNSTFILPLAMCNKNTLNLSFSGLKSAFFRLWNTLEEKSEEEKANLSYALQCTISTILTKKVLLASQMTGINIISVSGGVISNKFLRVQFDLLAAKHGLDIYYADQKYSTDNAAMIAFAGYCKFKQGKKDLNNKVIVKSREDIAMTRLELVSSAV